MRKPKIHPTYGTSLVGINFRERWNIVAHATKQELETYIANYNHINKEKKNFDRHWWERREAIINESTQNIYLRKVWRKRHSESFQKEVLYRVDRNITRWNTKLGPKSGNGIATCYHFNRSKESALVKDDIIILTKVDEMGNLYFAKASDISAPNPYVFNRDNAQLGWILPLEV